ncbi:MAG: DUF5711 family protein [Clostridiales bacterium]|nr:DUF5711 family protein [Clostridiales bacterium]
MASKNKRDGNIIPFASDNRIRAVRFLKRVILFLFFVSFLFSAYIYRGNLNIHSLKRFTTYLNLGASKPVSLEGSMPLDSGISNCYSVIGGGLAVLNRDTLKYLNVAGSEDMEVQLDFSKPAISSSDKLLLCYDRGSNSICVSNTYKVIFQKSLTSSIINAAMGKNGAFSVVTDENGFRSAVTVFDNKQQEIYLWKTSEYFISSTAMSPSGKKMAAAVFYGDGINVVSKVIIFDMSKDKPIGEFPLDNESILAIHFVSDNHISVITDAKAAVYDLQKGLLNSFVYGHGALSGFAFPDDRGALLVLDSGTAKKAIHLTMLDKNGKKCAENVLQGEIQGISSLGRYVGILSTDKAFYLNRDLKEIREPEEALGAKEIYMRDDGSAFLIYNNRAELSMQK